MDTRTVVWDRARCSNVAATPLRRFNGVPGPSAFLNTPPLMFRVYVDEAGDRRISPKSSRYFVVAAVMVHESHNDKVRGQLADLKVELGRHRHQVLHFRNLRPAAKRERAAEAVSEFTIARIMSVIIDKDRIGEEGPAGDDSFISNCDPMYLWALRLLLERVSWYAQDRQKQDVLMTFSHVQGFKVGKLTAYRSALEKQREGEDMTIDWGLFDAHRFVVASPKTVDLLQVADIAASSIFQAVEPERNGPACLDALKSKIYRRPPRLITSYGLKVFPDRAIKPTGELHWLCGY
jgi:hypothetical protein